MAREEQAASRREKELEEMRKMRVMEEKLAEVRSWHQIIISCYCIDTDDSNHFALQDARVKAIVEQSLVETQVDSPSG